MFREWLKCNNLSNFDFSGEILPTAQNRELWDKFYTEKYVKNAEEYLNFNWPLIKASDYIAFSKEGNRTRQETPHFTRRAALCNLVIGEVLEHKGRFLPDIIDGLFLICEESFWGLSAHKHPEYRTEENLPDPTVPYIDLFVAETAATVTLTYHLLYDDIKDYCPELLTRIENEMNHRIIKPYLTRYDFIWMCYMGGWLVDNWLPWILSNLLTVFLLFVKDKRVLADGLKKMIYEIENIYETYPLDGGCDEGATYWGVSAGAMFEFCEQIYLATNGKINFFTDEIIQNIAKYEYRAYIGDGYFVNFADGTNKLTLPVNYIMYKYGKRIDDQKLSSLAKEIFAFRKEEELKSNNISFDNDTKLRRMIFDLVYEEEIKNEPDLVLDETCILENTENTFVRNGKWYYASKGGNNLERHNHHDVGSFMVYFDNEPLLIDPSCGTYTKQTFSKDRYKIWTMQSGWHNLPVINGCEQIGEYSVGGGAHNKADSFTLDGKTTKISFAAAYPEEAKIKNIVRNISASDTGVEITDTFDFKNLQNTVSEHFITPYSVQIKENKVIIGEKFVLSTDFDGAFTQDYVSFEGDGKLINCWNTDGLNRIKFNFNAVENAKITFTLKEI